MSKPVRICADCIHFVSRYRDDPGCGRTVQTTVDIVTGEQRTRMDGCYDQRSDHGYWLMRDKCGPNGRFFEGRS